MLKEVSTSCFNMPKTFDQVVHIGRHSCLWTSTILSQQLLINRILNISQMCTHTVTHFWEFVILIYHFYNFAENHEDWVQFLFVVESDFFDFFWVVTERLFINKINDATYFSFMINHWTQQHIINNTSTRKIINLSSKSLIILSFVDNNGFLGLVGFTCNTHIASIRKDVMITIIVFFNEESKFLIILVVNIIELCVISLPQ